MTLDATFGALADPTRRAVIGGAEPGSIGVHASCGFVHAGRMKSIGRKHGRWLDTVYMQRALGPGDSTPPPEEPQ